MRQNNLFLLSILSLLIGCAKNGRFPNPVPGPPPPYPRAQISFPKISFTLNYILFNYTNDYFDDFDSSFLMIGQDTSRYGLMIYISFFHSSSFHDTTTYTNVGISANGLRGEDYRTRISDPDTLTIIGNKDGLISGTFTGNLYDNAGKKYAITKGVFKSVSQ